MKWKPSERMAFYFEALHSFRWLSQMLSDIGGITNLIEPGNSDVGGSDTAAFLCYGVPAFELGSKRWDYENYTGHTNRDTFDKLIFDDLKNNAMLFAMLAYLATEDAQLIPRELRVTDPKTEKRPAWPVCKTPAAPRYSINRRLREMELVIDRAQPSRAQLSTVGVDHN